ncbi:MAG TPA: hypothetical protein VGL18_05240 [Actinomycetota bacterium]
MIEARSAKSRLLDLALWGASFFLLVLSFVLSWGPPPQFGPRFDWSDKAWHLLGYGALCGTLLLAAVWRPGRGGGRFGGTGLGVAVLVLVVAWSTEALQAPFHRDVQLLDALADLAGVTAGFLTWKVVIKNAHAKGPRPRPRPSNDRR